MKFISDNDDRPENMPDFIPKGAKVYFYSKKKKRKYFPDFKKKSKK